LVTSRFYQNRCRRLLKPGSVDHIRLFPIGYQIQDHLSLKPGRQQPVTVGYAGALSSRLDYSLIVDIIEANPNLHFIFAGKLYDDTWIAPFPKKPASTLLKHLSQHPHVTIIKHHADPAKQAATMAQFSVGWIPYDTRIPFNRYCLPTKFLEYLAVGLPVLATPIPTLKEYPDLISIFTTPVTFRSSLKHALSQRHPEDVENRKRFARQHDLSVKAEQVIALLYPTITPVSQEPV
jgi:glycosyltransferase involved in cell wall biosynthesis